MSEITLLCNVCNKSAHNRCKLCGKIACSEHYDVKTGLCRSCKKGRMAARK